MANKPTQPLFPLGIETAEQSKLKGILNTDIIEHGPDAIMTVPETKAADGLPSAVRYNSETDDFEGFYEHGGWLPLGGGGVRWEVLPHAPTATLESGRGYLINNTSGASTVVLPLPTRIGDSVTVCDMYGKFSVYPLTIDPNGKAMYGNVEAMTISTDSATATFTWTGDARGWIITAGVGLGQGRVYSRTIYSDTLGFPTSEVTLATQPSIVDVYVDGKRLVESKYSLSGYEVRFSPSLPAGVELQVVQYVPIQLGLGSGGSDSGITPWVYNGGAAVGGETTISVPDLALGVPFITINGYANYPGFAYSYDAGAHVLTFGTPLEAGDMVVLMLSGEVAGNIPVNTSAGFLAIEALRRTYAEAGYNLVDGSFGRGGTVNTVTDLLLNEVDGKAYSWGGTLPKTVPADSTPISSGGLGISVWVDRSAAPNSFTQTGAGAVTRPAQDKMREEYSVQDFGAKVNSGVDETDNIKKCLAHVKAKGGRAKINFQPGEYMVRGTELIVDFSNVMLEGYGVILKLVDSPTAIQGPVLKIAQYGDPTVRGTVENVIVKGFTIYGNKLNQIQTMNAGGDANNPGFVSEDVVNLHVEDVIVYDCDGYGFLFAGSNLPHRKGAYFKNCWAFGNNVDGFDIKAGFNHVTLDSCRSWGNGYAPIVALRSGMGFDTRGKDVTLINCVGGDEGSNYAGNFRVRENAEAGISFLGCHSYNSPNGTYGFMCIGGGNTNVSLIGCTSSNDGTSIKHERGHLTVVGFRSWKPKLLSILQYPSQFVLSTLTEAATFSSYGESVTIYPSDYLSATVGSEIKIPTDAGTIYLLVTQAVASTLVCTVLRGNLGTAAVGASITTVSTGSLTVHGGISYQSASDAVQFASTLQTLTDSSMPATFNGFVIEAPTRYGVNFQGGDVSFYGGAIRNCGKGSSSPGFFVGNAATAESTFRLDSVFMGNDDKSFTQSAGIQFQSTSLAKGSVRACKFADNANSPVIGSPSSGVRFADNIGYTNEGTFSTTIDVTTVGVKTFSIPHGLSKAPSGKDVQLTIQRSGAANDYVLSTPMITGASSTIISGRVSVLTASATAGEAATVNAFISANP